MLKKTMLLIFACAAPALCDIAVTPGSGKTVATTTDQSREFQNVVVSTSYINNAAGVPTPIGYATGGSSMPVSVLNFPASQAVTGTFFQASQPTTVSTGGVTAAQGPPGTADWPVRVSTLNVSVIYQPTVLGATVTYNGTQNVGQSGTWTMQPGNTANTTDWRVTMSTNNVVINQPTVLGATVTYNGTQQVTVGTLYQPGSTVMATTTTLQGSQSMIGQTAIGVLSVTGSTSTVGFQAGQSSVPVVLQGITLTGTSLNVNVTGGSTITSNSVNITTSTIDTALQSQGALGIVAGPTGLAQVQRVDASSNTYMVPQLLVSSATTLPATAADKSSTTALGDNEGRQVFMAGAPTALYLTTSPVVSNSGYAVLVASPASTLFTHMIGCIFRNTSATSTAIDIYSSGNAANTGTVDVPIEAVTVENRGIWTGPEKPFLNTTAGGVQVSMKVAAAVSTINGYCQYYQTTSP